MHAALAVFQWQIKSWAERGRGRRGNSIMWAAVLGLAGMISIPSRQLFQIPPVNSSAQACRDCYCDDLSQNCAEDGLRCVGGEVRRRMARR